ncbi:MAG: RtcB family protein [Gemmatimonadota bacterium]|nr:RtcB family protein [Gemmatimonadota bacterium]MDH5759501.1 RtcB family protein [Gemmatimonadota bacterium]
MDGNVTAVFGSHDEITLNQLADVASRAEMAALMADGHLGYVMPIGGVAAYRDRVSVVGVGFDIACGNAAIMTDLTTTGLLGMGRAELDRDPTRVASHPTLNVLADQLFDELSFGVGRRNQADDAPVDDPLFEDDGWSVLPTKRGVRHNLMGKARSQLGTIGSGNHYVDVFADEEGRIWVGVHFGSRGFGHTVASGFLALSQGGRWGDRAQEKEVLLDIREGIGEEYWALMNLAGRYAYAGREWVARKVVSMLGGRELDLVHNHHNFAWKEEHGGEELVVVRKGATPAWPGQRGFVGGSMGDDAVILVGSEEGTEKQASALFSTVHGAGRVMGRMAAKGKWKRGELVRPGLISHEMMGGWLVKKGVVRRGGDLDEAPQAYRRLPEVLAAQGDTVKVQHTLRPLIVCMAPGDTLDPYRD